MRIVITFMKKITKYVDEDELIVKDKLVLFCFLQIAILNFRFFKHTILPIFG